MNYVVKEYVIYRGAEARAIAMAAGYESWCRVTQWHQWPTTQTVVIKRDDIGFIVIQAQKSYHTFLKAVEDI